MKKKAYQLSPEELEALRPHIFTPCRSKEALHAYILLVLGLDLPDGHIDPQSNSSPMELVWELYDVCMRGGDPDYSQLLAYSAREGIKTLAASVFEVLSMVHLGRNVVHGAAIKQQSKKSQEYVKRMLGRPLLRDFVTSKNDSILEITRYVNNATGETLNPTQFGALELAQKNQYDEIKKSVVIVVATVQSMNGQHEPNLVLDELDVFTDMEAYEEGKNIPTESEDGGLPLTLMTSTRKYSFGIVQREIDNADESGLLVRHWNIIDVTRKCTPERHLPNEPEIPIYYSEDLLRAIPEKDWKLLDQETQKKYKMEKGSPGCLKNCKLYAMCRGRLKNQTSDSSMLKSIDHVQNVARKMSVQRVKAQLMCWKPSSEGLIYPYFDKAVHMVTASQMATMVTGDEYPDAFTKADLIALVKERGNKFTGGMDFGTTHCFATVTGFRDGNRFFIINAREVPDLEPTQQIDLCKTELEQLGTAFYPDTAMPGTIKMFKKAGFTMYDWKKKPGSVLEGIDTVRSLIMPAGSAPPRLYLLKGEDGCELLAKRIQQYHWKLGTDGKPTDIPDEDEDDVLDALRYAIMNQFASGGKVIASLGDNNTISSVAINPGAPRIPQNNYLTGLISEALGRPVQSGNENPDGEARGKKGKIHWDMS